MESHTRSVSPKQEGNPIIFHDMVDAEGHWAG